MKTLKQIQYLFVAVLAMAMAACTDNSPEEVFVPVELEGQGVYFAKATKLNYEVEGTEGSIDFKVYRTETSGPATVNVYSTTETTLFTIPETISFESGAAETTLTVSYANIVRGLKYDFNVGFEEGTDYGNSELNFTLLYPAEVIEEWEVISENAILTDNLYSMYGAANLTGEEISSLKNIVVEKEKNSEKYRFKSPYGAEYWLKVRGFTLPADFELPYIVIDGEYFQENYPNNPASKGAYMIPSVALGVVMENGVGAYFDPEEPNFGSVAGNLSTSAGPIGPDNASYAPGSYDKKTKTFDFGVTYHWLAGYGFYINSGTFTLSLDPALLETNYERDYTWAPLDEAEGYFSSELAGENWMINVEQSEEDPTFFKLVSPYAEGYHLYFFYDAETGKVKIPELQKSGLLCMDGEKNMIYMDGKGAATEDGEFTFALDFYHFDKATENRFDLATYEESFLWGRGPLDLFVKGLTIDDYQGTYAVPAYDEDGLAGNIKVTLTKYTDKYILANGLSVDGALGGDYDDTIILVYDAETGLLVFQPQNANKYTDAEGTYNAMAVPFNSTSFGLTTKETLTGGFMPDGTFQFINTPGNAGTWDSIVYGLVINGSFYFMNGYWSGLVWNPIAPSQSMKNIGTPYATRTQIQEWVKPEAPIDQWEKAAAPGKQELTNKVNGTAGYFTR